MTVNGALLINIILMSVLNFNDLDHFFTFFFFERENIILLRRTNNLIAPDEQVAINEIE